MSIVRALALIFRGLLHGRASLALENLAASSLLSSYAATTRSSSENEADGVFVKDTPRTAVWRPYGRAASRTGSAPSLVCQLPAAQSPPNLTR